jgi:hypothetical protein
MDAYGVLLIATAQSLAAFNPGYYVHQTLFAGGAIEDIAIRQDTRRIYFLGTVGGTRGIYRLAY